MVPLMTATSSSATESVSPSALLAPARASAAIIASVMVTTFMNPPFSLT
jgi:hypothetical protein